MFSTKIDSYLQSQTVFRSTGQRPASFRFWRHRAASIFSFKKREVIKRWAVVALIAFGVHAAPAHAKTADVVRRLSDAATVFSEIMSAPDKAIPRDLLARSECVIVVPGLKAGGFLVGAKYGKGFISCRRSKSSTWSAPGTIRVEGGSFGFQAGATETDLVMLVMNQQGRKSVLSSQYTLGGQAEIAAGPVGRSSSAQTSGWMDAGILSYSRSRGIFAGIALQGSTLRQDLDDNQALYGEKIDNQQIVDSRTVRRPAAARALLSQLTRYARASTVKSTE